MLTKGDWFMITKGKSNGKYLKDTRAVGGSSKMKIA